MELLVRIAEKVISTKYPELEPLPGLTRLQTMAFALTTLPPERVVELFAERTGEKVSNAQIYPLDYALKYLCKVEREMPPEQHLAFTSQKYLLTSGLVVMASVDGQIVFPKTTWLFDPALDALVEQEIFEHMEDTAEKEFEHTSLHLPPVSLNSMLALFKRTSKLIFENAALNNHIINVVMLPTPFKVPEKIIFYNSEPFPNIQPFLVSNMPHEEIRTSQLFTNTTLSTDERYLLLRLCTPYGNLYVNRAKNIFLLCLCSNKAELLHDLNKKHFSGRGNVVENTTPVLHGRYVLLVKSKLLAQRFVEVCFRLANRQEVSSTSDYIY